MCSAEGLLEVLPQCCESTRCAAVDNLVAHPDDQAAEEFWIDLDVYCYRLPVGAGKSAGQAIRLLRAQRRGAANVSNGGIALRCGKIRQLIESVCGCRLQPADGLSGECLGDRGDLAVEQAREELTLAGCGNRQIRERLLQAGVPATMRPRRKSSSSTVSNWL